VQDGAAMLDIGAESTRPGARPLTAHEEEQRLLPALRRIREAVRIPVSVDTYKPEVAAMALDAGAEILNDITGGQNRDMLTLAARRRCPIILMHNVSKAQRMRQTAHGPAHAAQDSATGEAFLSRFEEALKALAQRALQAGLAHWQIALDPGLGFGKTLAQNLLILKHTRRWASLGHPLMVGASRKSFIGEILDAPARARLMGDAAITTLAAAGGAAMLRVHDVKAMAQTLAMTRAVLDADADASLA
jgi:dihydropteroate synthase